MKIIVNLDIMMAKRKMGLTELSEKVDVTMANLSILKNNKAKAVRFSTLAAICKALECQPGDILEFIEDENDEDNAIDAQYVNYKKAMIIIITFVTLIIISYLGLTHLITQM